MTEYEWGVQYEYSPTKSERGNYVVISPSYEGAVNTLHAYRNVTAFGEVQLIRRPIPEWEVVNDD